MPASSVQKWFEQNDKDLTDDSNSPRYQSNPASVGRTGLYNPVHGGPTPTFPGSAANILVQKPQQSFRSPVESEPRGVRAVWGGEGDLHNSRQEV